HLFGLETKQGPFVSSRVECLEPFPGMLEVSAHRSALSAVYWTVTCGHHVNSSQCVND
ncbi:hypothetical protein RRG08_064426, partial [Elysia crispata]